MSVAQPLPIGFVFFSKLELPPLASPRLLVCVCVFDYHSCVSLNLSFRWILGPKMLSRPLPDGMCVTRCVANEWRFGPCAWL